jgi:hypothetical protein
MSKLTVWPTSLSPLEFASEMHGPKVCTTTLDPRRSEQRNRCSAKGPTWPTGQSDWAAILECNQSKWELVQNDPRKEGGSNKVGSGGAGWAEAMTT